MSKIPSGNCPYQFFSIAFLICRPLTDLRKNADHHQVGNTKEQRVKKKILSESRQRRGEFIFFSVATECSGIFSSVLVFFLPADLFGGPPLQKHSPFLFPLIRSTTRLVEGKHKRGLIKQKKRYPSTNLSFQPYDASFPVGQFVSKIRLGNCPYKNIQYKKGLIEQKERTSLNKSFLSIRFNVTVCTKHVFGIPLLFNFSKPS